MPEGDTIWRTAETLRHRLIERTVTLARPAALHRLAGRRLRGVEPVGKHLYMHFDGGLTLHTHMRMTGAWHLYRSGERWRRAAHLATAILDFDADQAVLFAAPVCELITEASVGEGLGPDILATQFDVAEVVARARASDRPTVAEVLLDQAVCAGIGNIYRCDSLWYEGVDPMAPVRSLSDERLGAVYRRARDLMRRNAVADRFSVPSAVHRRGGRPCRRCGEPIRTVALGSPTRTLFWCERCQPPRFGTTA